MPLIRTGYQQRFEEICSEEPRFGRVSLVPWDSESFAFPVGAYQIGADELDAPSFQKLSELFFRWVRQNEVAVCSCTISGKNRFWKAYLPELGFRFVDFGLQASLADLSRAQLPDARIKLRRASAGDREAIETIAAQSFHHGRYHADPFFPTGLADIRYRDWVRRAFDDKDGLDRIYVMGKSRAVEGFYHITIEGLVSDLRLAAVSPDLQGTGLGFHLYVAILHVLKELGVHRAVTNMSAANTSVMNVYSTLGFRFSDPEAIYHWHSERMRSASSIT